MEKQQAGISAVQVVGGLHALIRNQARELRQAQSCVLV